jgi:hypothetical protein
MNLAQQLQTQIAREVPFGDVIIKVRLAPLDLWIKDGKVPTFFQETYLKATGGNKAERTITAEEAEKNGRDEIAFREQVVRYCLVDPPITPEGQEPKKNELTIEQVQLIPGLYEFVYGFGIFRGAQAVLNTKGGGIKADDLNTFREESGQSDSSGGDGGAVQSETISAAGIAG